MTQLPDEEWNFNDLFRRHEIEPLDIEGVFMMRAASKYDSSTDLPTEYCAYCLRAVVLDELDGWYFMEDVIPPRYSHRECMEMDGL